MKTFRFYILVTLLAFLAGQSAWADAVIVKYLDPTASIGQQRKSVSNPGQITAETTAIGSAGNTTWYYVSGTVTNNNRIEVSGTVNLILEDGCNFTVSKGIHVASGNALNIYAQSVANRGSLTASKMYNNAAIGGNGGNDCNDENGTADKGESSGKIAIYGGIITTTNGNIGGGNGGYGYFYEDEIGIGGDGGTITIYGGNINATTIGGGQGGDGDNESGYGYGSADIYLSWTSSADRIRSWTFNGAVQLMKTFVDEYNEDNIFPAGSEYDISNANLMPPIKAITTQAPTCTEVGYMQDC